MTPASPNCRHEVVTLYQRKAPKAKLSVFALFCFQCLKVIDRQSFTQLALENRGDILKSWIRGCNLQSSSVIFGPVPWTRLEDFCLHPAREFIEKRETGRIPQRLVIEAVVRCKCCGDEFDSFEVRSDQLTNRREEISAMAEQFWQEHLRKATLAKNSMYLWGGEDLKGAKEWNGNIRIPEDVTRGDIVDMVNTMKAALVVRREGGGVRAFSDYDALPQPFGGINVIEDPSIPPGDVLIVNGTATFNGRFLDEDRMARIPRALYREGPPQGIFAPVSRQEPVEPSCKIRKFRFKKEEQK